MSKIPVLWRAAAFVAVAASLVYANTLSYGAAWDDSRFVFASGATEGLAAVPVFFGQAMLQDMPAARGAYRPLTVTSYALDWELGNGQASFFHKTNVVLHALVSVLVLVLLVRLGAPLPAAVLGGLLFAVHPVHVEAAANIAGRSELLVTLFALLAVVSYLGPSRADAGPPGPVGTLGVLVLFAAALLAKEHGITVPALLVAVEVLRPGASGRVWTRLRERWPLWAGMGLVAAGYLVARRSALGTLTTYDVAPFIATLTPLQRVTTAIANWTEYARLQLFPFDLIVDYGPAVILPASFGDLRFWLGLAVGLGALLGAAWAYRRHRLGTLGMVWFGLALLPSSNLVVPIAQWLAERFFYLPSVGVSMAVAALAAALPSRLDERGRRLAVGAAAVVVLLFAGRTWTRNQAWVDTGTVIATLIAEHPESWRAQWFLGRMLFEQGRMDEAFTALDSATALQPHAIELPLERAEWLLRSGRPADAEALMRSLPYARHADREAHLVRSLAAQGRFPAADSAMAAARAAFPANPRIAALADSLTAVAR